MEIKQYTCSLLEFITSWVVYTITSTKSWFPVILKYFSVHVKSLLHTLLDIFLKIVLPLFLLLLKITSDIIFEYDFHTCNQNSSYHFLYWMYTLLWLAVYRKLVEITHLKRPNNITDLCLYQRGGEGWGRQEEDSPISS